MTETLASLMNKEGDMAGKAHARRPFTSTNPWLLWVGLGLTVVVLGLGAWWIDRGPFRSSLASNLLQAAVVVGGGGLLLKAFETWAGNRERDRETRLAKREADQEKRVELLRRMRGAHVQIASAQRLIKAERAIQTYAQQMHVLMLVARDLEEIREDVRAAKGLFKEPHRVAIVAGIGQILDYLHDGASEYTLWSNRDWKQPRLDHRRDNQWLADFIEDRPSSPSLLKRDNPKWEPATDYMPPAYERGLSRSKGTMREYVYGEANPAGAIADHDAQRTDEEELEQINIEIAEWQTGDGAVFDKELLAPRFAMRREDLTTFDDGAAFLNRIEASRKRITENFRVDLCTNTIAVVRCTIAMQAEGPAPLWNRHHNVRLFVRRSVADDWKLLAWANEPLTGTPTVTPPTT